MALIQPVKDGRVVEDSSDASSSTSGSGKKKNVNNTMGQEQFLQLLVAQMQYQDPLEPTSNTEWVAQMATFSMVESLNNMQQAFDKQSANALVGKYVLINDGDNGYVKGKVDYATKQDGKTKISVNDKLYDLDKLDTVADEEYYKGSVLANEFHEMVKLLPDEKNLTVNDAGLLKSAREEYEKMTDSQKQFVEKDALDKLRKLETKMDALKATQFTGLVNGLPSVSDVEAADEETLKGYVASLKKAADCYESLTETQRKNIGESTMTQYQEVTTAIQEAEKKFGHTSDDEDSKDDVASILQQILDELKSQKTE